MIVLARVAVLLRWQKILFFSLLAGSSGSVPPVLDGSSGSVRPVLWHRNDSWHPVLVRFGCFTIRFIIFGSVRALHEKHSWVVESYLAGVRI